MPWASRLGAAETQNNEMNGSEVPDYPTNCEIFDVVHSYIESTERL